MPHRGQVPGEPRRTCGCIEQVYAGFAMEGVDGGAETMRPH
jgi:hypothetical protein